MTAIEIAARRAGVGTRQHTAVLRVLAETRDPLTVFVVAQRAGMAPDSVRTRLAELRRAGVVKQVGWMRRYPWSDRRVALWRLMEDACDAKTSTSTS